MQTFQKRLISSIAVISMVAHLFPALPALAISAPTVSADGITSSGAFIRIVSTEASYIRIEYGTSANYTMYYPIGSTATSGSVNMWVESMPWQITPQLSGLTAGTLYHYRVGVCPMASQATCASSPATAFTYTSDQTFTTITPVDTLPPAQVTALSFSNISTTSATLNWIAPADPDANANPQMANRYEIKYREGGSFSDANWSSAWLAIGIPSPSAPGTQQSMSVANLKSGTSYTFAVKAFDAAGNASSLMAATATTQGVIRVDTSSPDRVTNVSGTTNANGVLLQWLAPQDRDADGAVTPAVRYEVRYKSTYSSNETEWWSTANVVANPPTPLSQGTTQYFNVPNLSSTIMYYFSIKAFDAAGNASQFSLPFGITPSTASTGSGSSALPSGNAILEVQVSSQTSGSSTATGVNRAKAYLYSDSSCTPSVAQGTANGETGSNGRYTFPGVPAGSYKLRIEPPSDRTDLSSMTWGCVTLNQGTLLQGIMMPVSQTTQPSPSGAILSVGVKDTTGSSVSGARVEACGPTAASACQTMESGTVAGTYLLRNAQGGTYTLRAYPPSSRSDLSMVSITATISANTSAEFGMTLPKNQTQPTPNWGAWPQTKTECDNYYGQWCAPNGFMSQGSCMMMGQTCPTKAPPNPMPQTESACSSQGLYWCTWNGGGSGCSMMQCTTPAPAGLMTCPDGKTFKTTISECPKISQTLPEPVTGYPTFSGVWSGGYTQSSAIIYYSIDKPAQVTIEYKQKLDDPWMPAGSQTIGAGDSYSNRTFSLPSLKAGTTYFYRLTALANGFSSSYPGPNVSPAQFVTTFDTNNNSSLPKGSSTLTIIVQDEKGTPIGNATVGISTCGSHTYYPPVAASTAPYTPCAGASSPTSASGLVAFTEIASGSYTIGVSPSWSSTGVREYEYLTDKSVVLSEGEQKREIVTLKKIGSGIITDLPLSDVRMEFMPQEFDLAAWIRWYTPRPASGRIEYGLTEQYELPAYELPGFASYHEGKLQLKPETAYYYRLKSQDERGIMGSASGKFTTPKSGGGDDPQMPFSIDWRKTNPQPGSPLPITDPSIHVEFIKSIDQTTVSRESIVFGGHDKSTVPYTVETFSNGFNLKIQGKLRANASYFLSIPASIKSNSGMPLMGTQHMQFYTTADDQKGSGSITGTVKLLNGTGVREATVVARGGMVYQKQLTNDKGEYTLSGLPAGTYQLAVYLPSYLGDYAPPQLPGVTVADEMIMKQDIVLAPSEYGIHGLVAYEDGSPVLDAMVGAYQTNGGRYVPPTPVDDQGHFRLSVSEGTWMVGVMAKSMNFQCDPKGPCPLAAAAQASYIMPNWNIPEKQTVTIDTNAKVRDVYFKVAKYKFEATVKGVIAKKDGGAINTESTRVRISARGGTKNFSRPIELSSDGSFATQLPPGLYDLFVETADEDVSAPPSLELRLSGQETKDLGTLYLESTNVSIKGSVRNERGQGVSGLTVQVWNKESGATLSEVTGPNGGYSMKVSRGDWIVYVATSDKYSSQNGGTVFIPAKKLPAKNINFTVQENTSLIRGFIIDKDRKKLSDVSGYVHARSTGKSKKGLGFQGSSVTNGEFTFALPEGSYVLNFEPSQNSFVAPLKEVTISVKPGETKTIELMVEDTRSANSALLKGSLVDRSGATITGVPFTVYAGSNNRWYNASGDQQTGTYSIKLPAGTWYIGYDVKDDAYGVSRGSSAVIKENEAKEVNLVVKRASAYLSGKTLDNEGNPLPNVSVILMGSTSNIPYAMGDSTYSDEEGAFEFYTEPGTYTLRAMVGEDSELTNPEEQTVTLAASGEQKATFTFVHGTIAVNGKTTVNGKAVGATVWAWSQKHGMKELDSEGTFSFRTLPDDTWYFSAAADIDRCVYRLDNASLTVGSKKQYSVALALKKSGTCLSTPVTVTTDADKPVVVRNTEGVKVAAPANAAATDGSVDISITPEPLPAVRGADRIVGQSYDIRVRTESGVDVKSFNSDLRITLPYDSKEVSNLNVKPADLSMKYWDGNAWKLISSCVADEKAKMITCSVDHATRFAIVAPPKALAKAKMVTKKATQIKKAAPPKKVTKGKQ